MLAVALLAVVLLAPVRVLAALDAVSWLLGPDVIAKSGQEADQRQGSEDSDQTAARALRRQRAHEAVKAVGVHRLPPWHRAANGGGRCFSDGRVWLQKS